MTGEEIARELISILQGINSMKLLACMHDRVALRIIKIIFPMVVDIRLLFSHARLSWREI